MQDITNPARFGYKIGDLDQKMVEDQASCEELFLCRIRHGLHPQDVLMRGSEAPDPKLLCPSPLFFFG